MTARVMAAVLLAFALVGCSPRHSENQDPRKGRVWVTEDCWNGNCSWDEKFCVGPDLLMEGDDYKRWFKDSEECKP